MQNIGLMMTYNEEDIIEEVMEANKKYFDKIFVLDGSSDKTTEILRSYDCVKYLLRDDEIFPKRRILDGARQFLLEKAQAMYGATGWFTLLHGDEIMVDNPNDVAARGEKAKAERINWHALNFFIHTSQVDEDFSDKRSIQEKIIYYHPGSLEIRQFRNKPNIYYNLNQIFNVVPTGIGMSTLLDYPIFKHYVVRSIKQKLIKPNSGLEISREGQVKNTTLSIKDIAKNKLDSHYKQLRLYDGSFHEFEPGNRPHFIRQWLRWHQYVPMQFLNWKF
jgi:glycosyltransferase involved in cell wall biosynthesis